MLILHISYDGINQNFIKSETDFNGHMTNTPDPPMLLFLKPCLVTEISQDVAALDQTLEVSERELP